MTNAKQVYEWVKTGHWNRQQFLEWAQPAQEPKTYSLLYPQAEYLAQPEQEPVAMDYENPVQSGRQAFDRGIKRHECPADPRTSANAIQWWLQGWDAAEKTAAGSLKTEAA